MKRSLTISLLSVLTATLSFSQTIYPKKIVLGQDTVVAIQVDQLRACNFLFVDRDRLYEIKDSLDVAIEQRDSLIKVQAGFNNNLMDSYDTLRTNYINSYNESENLKNTLKEANLEVKKQKLYKYSFAGLSVVLLTLLVVF